MWSDCSDTLPIQFTLIVQLDGRVIIEERVTFEGGSWSTEFGYG